MERSERNLRRFDQSANRELQKRPRVIQRPVPPRNKRAKEVEHIVLSFEMYLVRSVQSQTLRVPV